MKKITITCIALSLLLGGFTTNAMSPVAESYCIAAASSDWDKVLDEYEKYVDQLIETYKKAMSGDMAAMTEYANLAAKSQKLCSQLEKAKGDMNTAQMQRYLKILKKMTDAMSSM